MGGFSLIEVLVAMMIIMIAMASLALVLTRAYAAVNGSRQAQQASNLAQDALAQYEALPWTTVSDGLLLTDPTFVGDEGPGENITSGVGGYCFEGLSLVVNSSQPSGCAGTSTTWYNLPLISPCGVAIAPDVSTPTVMSGGSAYLVHERCVLYNGTSFEIAAFPTQVGSTPSAEEVMMTVAVSWGTAPTLDGVATHVTAAAIMSCGTTNGLAGSC